MSARSPERTRVLLVTGMSGAGKSSALRALEDLGYEAVDNLRLDLIPNLLPVGGALSPALAIGVDTRTRDFSIEHFAAVCDPLAERDDLDLKLIYLDCDNEVLQRRYTETRRRHPLAVDRPLPDGIRHERRLIRPLRDRAWLAIDTSSMSVSGLRRMIEADFALDTRPGLIVFVTSFAFRHGLPREADMVLDVRFLSNPHYVDHLRPLTGLHPEVAAHIAADRDFPTFFERTTRMLLPLLPRYNEEGKSYLTIAVGCTGGRHRSVYVAERLAADIGREGYPVRVRHRDIDANIEQSGA